MRAFFAFAIFVFALVIDSSIASTTASVIDPGSAFTTTLSAVATAPATHSFEFVLVAANSVVAPMEQLCVSIAQAARMLSISRSQMYNLIRAGHFQVIKIAGKRSAIEVDALRQYLAKCIAATPKPVIAADNHAGADRSSTTGADRAAVEATQ